MDLSALIFVALAVAWAVYLVPKALRHHEEDALSRSVDGFSDRLRVLARREAVSASEATLVPTGRPVASPVASPTAAATVAEQAAPVADRADSTTDSTTEESTDATPTPAPRTPRADGLSPVQRRLRQAAARRAAQRRRRVFNFLLLAIVVVGALAVGKVVEVPWVAAPAGLMALWLVACRLMVRRERAVRASQAAQARVRKRRRTLAEEAIAAEDVAAAEIDNTDEIPVVRAALLDQPPAAQADPDAWTPVPVPLPTYVAKEPAGRTVRTIDLDSTGVWSSGRNEADSQLAREADAQRSRAEAEPDGEQRRATGS